MSTNDRKIIRTEHVPTGQMVDFYLSKDISPSVNKKIFEWEELEDQAKALNNKDKLNKDEKIELAELYTKITDLGLQIFASLLDPVDGIPGELKKQFGYKNKFDYVSDCAKSNYVIGKTINFFYDLLPSSTESAADKDYRKHLEGQVLLVDKED